MSDSIETALAQALSHATHTAPSRLASALRYAVFPGGARIRPRLCLAVAAAGGEAPSASCLAAACSLELLHCASLVHDDLPCFDDAALRRGKPALHKLYGEALAVLTGDALIVLAFEHTARVASVSPTALATMPALIATLARAAGSPRGLVAGQAYESEPTVPLTRYHGAKTGALFVAATTLGAIASGQDPAPWVRVGEAIGEAYQIADDLRDELASPEEVGKSTHRDAALGRPNAVHRMGVDAALEQLRALGEEASSLVPAGPGCEKLRELLRHTLLCMLPRSASRGAA